MGQASVDGSDVEDLEIRAVIDEHCGASGGGDVVTADRAQAAVSAHAFNRQKKHSGDHTQATPADCL